MDTTHIDETLVIQLPAGFRVMEKAEVQKVFSLDYQDLWGAWDEERHILLAIVWKDAPKLLGKLVSTKDLVDRAQKSLNKSYGTSGYHLDGRFDTQIAGCEAKGISYGYLVKDISQDGEVIIFRHGRRTYTLYYYARTELAEQSQPIHDALLESLTFEG